MIHFVALLLVFLTATTPVNAKDFTFWYGSRGNTGNVIADLCQTYNNLHPHQQVICSNLGSYEATLQKTIASYRAGKQPALVQLFDVAILDMLMSGTTVPINQGKISVYGDDYFNAITDIYGSAGGGLHSFPFNVSTIVLYTNRQKLEAAGVKQPPDTWEAFEKALKRLKGAGESCPWAFQLHPWYLMEQFSAVHNIPIATQRNGYDGLDAQYLIANNKNRRMMEDIKRWYDQKLAVLDSNLAFGNPVRAFGIGDCAMLIESTAAFSATSKLSQGKFDTTISLIPHYYGSQRNNSLVGGASLWVMKGFDEETYQAVDAFLAFLNTPENRLYFSNKTGFLPVTKSSWELLQANKATLTSAYQLAKTGLSSINNTTDDDKLPGLRLGFYMQFRQLWIKEMQRAFANQQSIVQALEKTEKSGNLLLQRFERIYQDQHIPQ